MGPFNITDNIIGGLKRMYISLESERGRNCAQHVLESRTLVQTWQNRIFLLNLRLSFKGNGERRTIFSTFEDTQINRRA